MDQGQSDNIESKTPKPSKDELTKILDKWRTLAQQKEAIKAAKPFDTSRLEVPVPEIKDELIRLELITILKQRNAQREKIFGLAKHYCWTSLILLILIVVVQIAGRVVGPNHHFGVFSGNELQIIVIGVFGQFVGLLYIITKSLYDDKHYKDVFKDSIGRKE